MTGQIAASLHGFEVHAVYMCVSVWVCVCVFFCVFSFINWFHEAPWTPASSTASGTSSNWTSGTASAGAIAKRCSQCHNKHGAICCAAHIEEVPSISQPQGRVYLATPTFAGQCQNLALSRLEWLLYEWLPDATRYPLAGPQKYALCCPQPNSLQGSSWIIIHSCCDKG